MILRDDLDKEWVKLEQRFFRKFKKKPDVEAVLMIIGLQELRNSKQQFDKEEKQDLMHIAVCTILSQDGYFHLREYDEDGWPHFDKIKDLPKYNGVQQEQFLKQNIIRYFEKEDSFMHT